MVKRRKVGIIYQYNENWIGGTYYIENLISALNHLVDDEKPALIIFTDDEDSYVKLVTKIAYPYIAYRPYFRKLRFIERASNLAYRSIFKKNIFFPYYNDLDIVFPGKNEHKFIEGQKFLYWIPDFQENFLPEFFSNEELVGRKHWHQSILSNARHIVFSSNTVKQHFNQIYPNANLSQYVLRFAVTHSATSSTIKLSDFRIPEIFFICSNQFWKHKNHIVILKAISLLKIRGVEIFVALTGKEHDSRHPDYFNNLREIAEELSIEENIKFLGFLDREIQLQLMKNSLAVIQPSLFEGWSTVVEDAKSLGTHIIASNLDVHVEQLESYTAKEFFNPHNEDELAFILEQMFVKRKSELEYDYLADVQRFGRTFHAILEEIVNT